MSETKNTIENEITLNAPIAKVWDAIIEPVNFGKWFGVNFETKQFTVGEHAVGKVTYPGYEHVVFDIIIDKIEPMKLFSFKWHPFGIDQNYDYSQEPMTLNRFELKETESGTLLTLVESGFNDIPESRRDEAYKMNSGGWGMQMKNIEEFLNNN